MKYFSEGSCFVLNTLHLKYAVEVERTGSITQAAENLFMGQPNLSKAIMELEETLGFLIFERTSKGVIPTTKGKSFLIYAKNVLTQIEKMEALCDDNSAQSLSIAVPRCNYITAAISKFSQGLNFEGKVRLNVRETNAVQVINGVAMGTFGFGIVRYRLLHEKYFTDYIKDKDLDAIPFWEFDSAVTISDRNRDLLEKISYQTLCDMTPIVYGDESIPYLSFGEVRREAKSPAAEKAIFVYDRATAMEFLRVLPNAYMISAPSQAEVLSQYGLIQKKCEVSNEKCRDVFVFQKGYKFSEVEKDFINILSETKNKIEFDFR